MNLRRSELEVRQLGLDGLAQRLRRLDPAAAELARRLEIGLARHLDIGLELGQRRLATLQRRKLGAILRQHRRQLIDDHMMLACRGAQREQPALDLLQFMRIERHLTLQRFDGFRGLVERGEALVERIDQRLEHRHAAIDLAHQPPHQRRPAPGPARSARTEFRRHRAILVRAFSSCISRCRFSASASSSPDSGAARQAPRPRGAHSPRAPQPR